MAQLNLILGAGQALGKDGVRLALLAARNRVEKSEVKKEKGGNKEGGGEEEEEEKEKEKEEEMDQDHDGREVTRHSHSRSRSRGGIFLPQNVAALLQPDANACNVKVLESRTYAFASVDGDGTFLF